MPRLAGQVGHRTEGDSVQIKKALAAAALSLGLVGGVASPALAAGAQPMKESFQFTECFTENEPSLPPFTFCVDGAFTTKFIDKGSDTFLAQSKGTSSFTVVENGVVTERFTSQSSFMVKVRNGQEQIFKIKDSGSFGDCTFEFKFLVVKGVVKQEVENFTCDGFGGGDEAA